MACLVLDVCTAASVSLLSPPFSLGSFSLDAYRVEASDRPLIFLVLEFPINLGSDADCGYTCMRYYAGRVLSGKRNVTVWCPSVCQS